MRMLTRTAGIELAPHGILVTGVGPGAVDTPINASTAADPAKMKTLNAAIPIGRMAEPEEIGSVVAFLAGKGATYLAATTIFADGGIMHSSPDSDPTGPLALGPARRQRLRASQTTNIRTSTARTIHTGQEPKTSRRSVRCSHSRSSGEPTFGRWCAGLRALLPLLPIGATLLGSARVEQGRPDLPPPSGRGQAASGVT